MNVSRYACYYGAGRLADLAAFDLVILQPGHYTRDEIDALARQGTQALAYLSISEETFPYPPASWYLPDPESGAPIVNPRWQSALVDCNSLAWRAHLLQERIPTILDGGFRGLFLDTLDVSERFQALRPGIIQTVSAIRSTFPDLILLANRGFSILNDTITVFDAVLFEAFSTRHSDGTYAAWKGEDLAWTGAVARWLRRLRRELLILTLDYADSSCPQLRAFAESRARAYGFIPFVTDYRLEWLPSTPT